MPKNTNNYSETVGEKYVPNVSQAKHNGSSTYRWLISSLMIIFFINGLSISLIIPIIPELFSHSSSSLLGSDASDMIRHFYYGLSFALFLLGSFGGLPLWGIVSDHIGRKPVLLIGMTGVACSYALCAWSIHIHNAYIFLLSRLTLGFFVAIYSIAQAIMADISEDTQDKIKKMRWPSLGLVLGVIVGPLFTMSIASLGWFNYQQLALPFLAAGCFSLLNAFLTNLDL